MERDDGVSGGFSGHKRKREGYLHDTTRRTRERTSNDVTLYGAIWRIDTHLILYHRMTRLIDAYDANVPIIVHPAVTFEENICSFLRGASTEAGVTPLALHTSLAVCLGKCFIYVFIYFLELFVDH